jgi:hypothetical protein
MARHAFETIHSVLTPDAGYVTNILIGDNDLPYVTISIAASWEDNAKAVTFRYAEGDIVIVPYTNIRCISISPEVKDQKDAPHLKSPFKKVIK